MLVKLNDLKSGIWEYIISGIQKDSTCATYWNVYNQINNDLGNEPIIRAFRKKNMEQYIFDKQKEKSCKYILNFVIILNKIIQYLVEENYIKDVYYLKSPKGKKKEITIFNESEFNSFKNYLFHEINYKNIGLLIASYTGIRIGELCALQFKDINFDRKSIEINKTLQRIKNLEKENKKTKIVISPPKTTSSIREIPLNEEIIKLINKLGFHKECYVLTNNKKYIEPRTLENYYKKILNKCDLKELNFHIIRHTFATNCLEKGVEIKVLSEILGHASVKTTMDLYLHVSLDLKRKELKKLSAK